MRFREWEARVNGLMIKKYGVGVDDLPDMPYHDWYTDEWTVEEAVKEAIDITNKGEWI